MSVFADEIFVTVTGSGFKSWSSIESRLHSGGAVKYIRADLAAQSDPMDVEALTLEVSEHLEMSEHDVRHVLKHLASRRLIGQPQQTGETKND